MPFVVKLKFAMPFDAVVVFAKYPVPGKVKSRLGAAIGPGRAAALYGLFLRYLSWRLRRLPKGLALFIAVDPPGARQRILSFFPYSHRTRFFPQKGEDLGARMLNATRDAQRRGARKVLIIGSDCLEISVGHLTKGLEQLGEKDLVLGKAKDGGYYLLGWKKPVPKCFKGVAWSTETVLRRTTFNARKAGLSVGFLSTLPDVDEIGDLRRLARGLDSRNPVTRPLGRACRQALLGSVHRINDL